MKESWNGVTARAGEEVGNKIIAGILILLVLTVKW
jgi:hypothetical protein